MDQGHLSVEIIANWLSGRLEHDQVRTQVIPHLLGACPACSQAYREVLSCQKEMGHWDELIAVQESQEAPQLFDLLMSGSFEDQLRKVEEDESLHQWGLCQLLLAKGVESLFSEPARALEMAELAVRITRFLGDAYHRDWIRDLRARALSHVANALRILGEFRGADAAFRAADDCLARSASGNTQIHAEIADLKSSLRRDQRRWEEALDLSTQAADLYEQSGDLRGVAKAKLQKARILSEAGGLEAAISILQSLASDLSSAEGSGIYACARFNLLCCLVQAGRLEEAEGLVPEVRALVPPASAPLKAVHLVWAEGQIHFGRGRLDQAEAAFKQAQREFLDRRMAYDAALVSLDLAILLAQQGRTEELKSLSLESMAVFESREIHREAMATLLMFQEACREEMLTAEMARQLAQHLRRDRRPGSAE